MSNSRDEGNRKEFFLPEGLFELSSSDESEDSPRISSRLPRQEEALIAHKRSRSEDKITEADMEFYRLALKNAIMIWRMIPSYGDYINGALFRRFKTPEEIASEYRRNASNVLGVDPVTLAGCEVKDIQRLLASDSAARRQMPEISIYASEDPEGFEGQGHEVDVNRVTVMYNANQHGRETAYRKDVDNFVTKYVNSKRAALGVESESTLGAYTAMILYIGRDKPLCDLIAESRGESVVGKDVIEKRLRDSGFLAAVSAKAPASQGRNL